MDVAAGGEADLLSSAYPSGFMELRMRRRLGEGGASVIVAQPCYVCRMFRRSRDVGDMTFARGETVWAHCLIDKTDKIKLGKSALDS